MITSKIHTIGYGNRSLVSFISILLDNKIDMLVDVRSKPFSRFRPEFNKKRLSDVLEKVGIRYIHIEALGGKPKGLELYADGKLCYERLQRTRGYQEGIGQLEYMLELGLKPMLMCSELDYHNCHRWSLLGVDLNKRGWEIIHIDKTGCPTHH